MNPVTTIKSVFVAGLFAILAMWALAKVQGQGGALSRFLP